MVKTLLFGVCKMGVGAAVVAGLSLASAVGNYNASKSEARNVVKQGNIAMDRRADEIKALAAKQRVSYLQAGLELEGTPQAVISDTYNTGIEDVNAIRESTNQQSKNIITKARAKLLGDIAKTAVSAWSMGAGSGASSFSASSGAVSSGGEWVGTTQDGLNIFDLTGTAKTGGNVNVTNAIYKGV